MRAAVEAALGADPTPDPVVHGALRCSLLGSSSMTYYDLDREEFVVVEPLVDTGELQSWSS